VLLELALAAVLAWLAAFVLGFFLLFEGVPPRTPRGFWLEVLAAAVLATAWVVLVVEVVR